MKINPAPMRQPSLKEMHARRCLLLGIDRAKWPALWEEEKKLLAAARAGDGSRRSRRRRRAQSGT